MSKKELYGPTGWISFIIFSLSFLGPFVGLMLLFSNFEQSEYMFPQLKTNENWHVYRNTCLLFYLFIFIWQWFISFRLKNYLTKESITLMKSFLLLSPIVNVLGIFLIEEIIFHQVLSMDKNISGLITAYIINIIWVIYFHKSKRVINTYLSNKLEEYNPSKLGFYLIEGLLLFIILLSATQSTNNTQATETYSQEQSKKTNLQNNVQPIAEINVTDENLNKTNVILSSYSINYANSNYNVAETDNVVVQIINNTNRNLNGIRVSINVKNMFNEQICAIPSYDIVTPLTVGTNNVTIANLTFFNSNCFSELQKSTYWTFTPIKIAY